MCYREEVDVEHDQQPHDQQDGRQGPDRTEHVHPGGAPEVSPVEAAFGAYLGEAAARAERLRTEAARALVLAARQASDLGWSQRRIAAALGRSQPEVARLLRRIDLVPPTVAVTLDSGAGDEHSDRPPAQGVGSMLSRVLGEDRDAIVAAAERYGITNVRVFGSVARGEDGPDSDVDLLVDLAPGVSLFDLGRAEVDLVQILGRPVDVVPERMLKPRVAATVEAIAL
jgi:predicted nucleotidyltransferase